MTGKQRMLNAYRGQENDRIAIAPEFWCYYPARILGVDMIQFEREVPFHKALKTAFARFGCEGWGIVSPHFPNPNVDRRSAERWDGERLEVRWTARTPHGELCGAQLYDRREPGWTLERPIKNLERDLQAYEFLTLGGDPALFDPAALLRAREDVGEAYLLEACLGVPFFDYYAGGRDGGFEAAVFDFLENEALLEGLQERYIACLAPRAEAICTKTPYESLFIGCSWSCNSLIGPARWRRWDKPVIKAVVDVAHRHGRLVHVHFHGKCLRTVADFAELGIDCVCPFERPPGGDVAGLAGLAQVARLLAGRTTMNGNLQTVETLIRGTPADVRREVREVLTAFAGNPRVILGTGDQVGRETPEENIVAMIEEAKICCGKGADAGGTFPGVADGHDNICQIAGV
ncbi:MAG: uroporphyrinogen decarboxylase family protein [Planctomycetota bacterium]